MYGERSIHILDLSPLSDKTNKWYDSKHVIDALYQIKIIVKSKWVKSMSSWCRLMIDLNDLQPATLGQTTSWWLTNCVNWSLKRPFKGGRESWSQQIWSIILLFIQIFLCVKYGDMVRLQSWAQSTNLFKYLHDNFKQHLLI